VYVVDYVKRISIRYLSQLVRSEERYFTGNDLCVWLFRICICYMIGSTL